MKAAQQEKSLKIEEVSKQSGLTQRAIRYYEDIGILPKPERTQGGTRRYKAEHVELLQKITRMKEALGFSLEEILRFMKLNDTLDSFREGYKTLNNPKKKIAKLREGLAVINAQLSLLEEKIMKIRKIKTELLSLKKRTESAIVKLQTTGEA